MNRTVTNFAVIGYWTILDAARLCFRFHIYCDDSNRGRLEESVIEHRGYISHLWL